MQVYTISCNPMHPANSTQLNATQRISTQRNATHTHLNSMQQRNTTQLHATPLNSTTQRNANRMNQYACLRPAKHHTRTVPWCRPAKTSHPGRWLGGALPNITPRAVPWCRTAKHRTPVHRNAPQKRCRALLLGTGVATTGAAMASLSPLRTLHAAKV